MSTATRSKTTNGLASSRRHSTMIIGLVSALCVLAIGALQGGIAMITNPTEPLGMTVEFLERTPVDTYLWPGMFLMAMAAASLVTSIGLMTGWHWGWAGRIEAVVGYRWPWLGSLAVGVVLLSFEVTELFFVPFHPMMHPLLIALSAAIIGLTMTRSVKSDLAVPGDR